MATSLTPSFDETCLLSAELEVVATFDLAALRDHFACGTGVMRDSVDGDTRTLWLHLVPSETGLEDAVRRYVAIVDALPHDLRSAWDACSDRCMNTGIQAGDVPHAFHVRLSSTSLAELARVSIRLEFSIYAPDRDGPPDSAP